MQAGHVRPLRLQELVGDLIEFELLSKTTCYFLSDTKYESMTCHCGILGNV